MLVLVALALFASAPATGNAGTVLVLGDSIGAALGVPAGSGWVELLARELEPRDVRVVNASISGETTEGAKERLPQLLGEYKPSIVIIELGGNDGLRGFPLAVTRANFDAMITAATATGARVLLAGMRIPPNYGPRYTEQLHALYADLAKTHSTALVPFLLEGIATDPALMQDDGIHPNTAAQPRLLAQVLPVLEPLLAR
jgi:acyl-CoA thioesterase-1